MSTRTSVAERADLAGLGRRRSSGLSILDLPGGTLLTVPVARLASDPTNVRTVLPPDDELAAMIDTARAHGIFVPVLGCTVEAYNRWHPQTPVDAERFSHVLLDGNVRGEVANRAGLRELRVDVHDELAAPEKKELLQLVTGLHAHRPNPVDIAESIRRVQTTDPALRTQAAVGAKLGMHQTTVLRYLEVLDIPVFARELLRAGKVSRSGAVELASLADVEDGMRRAWQRSQAGNDVSLSSAIVDVRHEANADASLAHLTAADLPVLTAAARSRARLVDEADTGQHSTCLAGYVRDDDGTIAWYCTTPEVHDAPARARADARYAAVLQVLAAAHPTGRPTPPAFLAAIVRGPLRHDGAVRYAARCAEDLGWLPDDKDRAAYVEWIAAGHGGPGIGRFVDALALAYDEMHLRATDPWTDRDEAYLTLLEQRGGLERTPWETERLDARLTTEALAS